MDVPMQGASGIPLDKTESKTNDIMISSSKNGNHLCRKIKKNQLVEPQTRRNGITINVIEI